MTAKRWLWLLNRGLISHSFLQLFQDFDYQLLNREWPNKKERAKRNEHKLECEKGDNFTKIVSTTLLIGSKNKFYEIFAQQHALLIPYFLANFLVTKSRLSLSNTEILCEEYLQL